MAYKRYGRGRKRRRRGNKYMRYANTAARALQIATRVAGLVNTEFKYFDVSTESASVAIDEDGVGAPLCNMAQSVTAYGRTGDQCKVKRIQCKGYITCATDGTNSLTRVQLVKSIKGDTSIMSTLYENTANERVAPLEPKWPENRKNFKVLWTKYIIAGPNEPTINYFQFNIPLHDVVVYDKGTNTATANQFYLIAQSTKDSAGATTNQPHMDYWARVWYIDN